MYTIYSNQNDYYYPYRLYPYMNTPPYHPYPYYQNRAMWSDHGPNPFVMNVAQATRQNENYRTTLWTGNYLQLTLMHLNVNEDIGLEIHRDHDQFIRIEEGEGLVMMGDESNALTFQHPVFPGDIIMIPAGKWHNLINTGGTPLKLYSLYAPPEHAYGTINPTKPST